MGKNATELILKAIASDTNLPKMLSANNAISLALKKYRYYHPAVARILRWNREVRILLTKY